MRQIVLFLTVFVFLLASCKKNVTALVIQPGTYKGTFKRNYYPTASNVVLTFDGNKFEGQSDTNHYPAICNGSFSTTKDSVSFNNLCFYTADFDWSLILSRNYKLLVAGDSLIISRGGGDFIHYDDIYKLKKQ